MHSICRRLRGLYSISRVDGVIHEDRDFGNFTPQINRDAATLIEKLENDIVELREDISIQNECIAKLKKELRCKTYNDLSTVQGREQEMLDNLHNELK